MEGFTQNILLQNPHEWSVRWARLQLGSVFRRGTPPAHWWHCRVAGERGPQLSHNILQHLLQKYIL